MTEKVVKDTAPLPAYTVQIPRGINVQKIGYIILETNDFKF